MRSSELGKQILKCQLGEKFKRGWLKLLEKKWEMCSGRRAVGASSELNSSPFKWILYWYSARVYGGSV